MGRSAWYEEILSKVPGKQILVLGDLMVDEYIWGNASRISPEAPVPIVEVRRETLRPGGAANVASNIAALGGRASIVGILGSDVPGEWLVDELEALGIKGDGVVIDRTRPTTVKTRVVAGSQQIVRFDRESGEEPGGEVVERLLTLALERLPKVDALLISDYTKGVISPRLLKGLLPAARRLKKIVAVDPKIPHFFSYKSATVITPNHHEAAAVAGIPIKKEEDLVRIGWSLLKKVGASALLVTKGERGMSLFEQEGMVAHIPAVAKEVYDVTGAGDTVVASFTLALAAGSSMRRAAIIANHAASVVVGKVGTATVSLDELAAALREGDGG